MTHLRHIQLNQEPDGQPYAILSSEKLFSYLIPLNYYLHGWKGNIKAKELIFINSISCYSKGIIIGKLTQTGIYLEPSDNLELRTDTGSSFINCSY